MIRMTYFWRHSSSSVFPRKNPPRKSSKGQGCTSAGLLYRKHYSPFEIKMFILYQRMHLSAGGSVSVQLGPKSVLHIQAYLCTLHHQLLCQIITLSPDHVGWVYKVQKAPTQGGGVGLQGRDFLGSQPYPSTMAKSQRCTASVSPSPTY